MTYNYSCKYKTKNDENSNQQRKFKSSTETQLRNDLNLCNRQVG